MAINAKFLYQICVTKKKKKTEFNRIIRFHTLLSLISLVLTKEQYILKKTCS